MQENSTKHPDIENIDWIHTIIIGSGAAGLNAALQLWNSGVTDILILTEGLDKGTSINTGSDKQTYYKLSQYGEDEDSPVRMAETYFAGGSMHGDIALIEAANSTRAFYNLVNAGVPFPHDTYGQFIGYKTDHDPRRRATSIGPYTSQEMCRALIKQIHLFKIPVWEGWVVTRLVVVEEDGSKRVAGVIAVDDTGQIKPIGCENVIFAVGGPGGLYATSVYPSGHTGAIGLALMEGAEAQNIPESQYGLASIKYRWNVSGSYMQVVPRFISCASDGVSEESEFLNEYFAKSGDLHTLTFLKGYQWPFDSRKVAGGSSLIDILVYIETVIRKRRVFLDYRSNPSGFLLDQLGEEAHNYLLKSNAVGPTPIQRLLEMNPAAYGLYQKNGIDLTTEPLEIAVCAQHNNGGLAGTIWWESTNIKHLFPVGEVNGSHGVYRPGGAALNAGQVGSLRAASYIAKRYQNWSLDREFAIAEVKKVLKEETNWLARCEQSNKSWRDIRSEFQKRMSAFGAHIRALGEVGKACQQAKLQWSQLVNEGCTYQSNQEIVDLFRTRYLCFSHLVYLESISFAIESGVGSRGSMIVLDDHGESIHPQLPSGWKYQVEKQSYRNQLLISKADIDGNVVCTWIDRRPIPEVDGWFETVWAGFRQGKIYD